MMRMMETCWNWMMSLGLVGLLLGIGFLVALVVLIVGLIRRSQKPR